MLQSVWFRFSMRVSTTKILSTIVQFSLVDVVDDEYIYRLERSEGRMDKI